MAKLGKRSASFNLRATVEGKTAGNKRSSDAGQQKEPDRNILLKYPSNALHSKKMCIINGKIRQEICVF